MNQQDPGSGPLTPSVGSVKRKRGRARKEESAVPENLTVMPTSDHVMNINETAGKTDDCDDVKVGHVITGVIEGTCDAGYLVNVQLAGSETCLRGVAFLSGHTSPITAEAILNQQAQIYSSAPSLGQCSEQPAEPESQIPISDNQVFPTELCSGISLSIDNQFAYLTIPGTHLPKDNAPICNEGILQGISEPGHESLTAFAMSELKCRKTLKKDETLHELDALRQIKEVNANGEGAAEDLQPKFLFPDEEFTAEQQAAYRHNLMEWICNDPNETVHDLDASRQVLEANANGGGATKDSEPTLESIKSDAVNLFPDEEELPTGQQVVPSVHKLNEVIQDDLTATLHEFNASGQVTEPSANGGGSTKGLEKTFEGINLVPINCFPDELTTEQQAVPSVYNLNEWIHNDPQNSYVELNQTPASAEPESLPSEQIRKSLFKIQYSRKRLASDISGSDSTPKTSYPSALFEKEVVTSAANTKVNVIQPSESLVNSVKPDIQIGSDNS